MRIVEKKKVMKEVEVIVKDYDECDMCKEEITNGTDTYDYHDFTLKFSTGTMYPSGGSGDEYTIDLCPTCAKVLVRMLEGLGYRVNKDDWYC